MSRGLRHWHKSSSECSRGHCECIPIVHTTSTSKDEPLDSVVAKFTHYNLRHYQNRGSPTGRHPAIIEKFNHRTRKIGLPPRSSFAGFGRPRLGVFVQIAGILAASCQQPSQFTVLGRVFVLVTFAILRLQHGHLFHFLRAAEPVCVWWIIWCAPHDLHFF